MEIHGDAGRRVNEPEQHGKQQAAGDRLGDAQLTQDGETVIEPLADEEDYMPIVTVKNAPMCRTPSCNSITGLTSLDLTKPLENSREAAG